MAQTDEQIRIDTLLKDLDVVSQLEDKDERKEAVLMAKKYLKDYSFEYASDKSVLRQLIYLEIINIRIQNSLNEFYRDAKAVPQQMVDSLHKNTIQLTALRETLGLVKDGKEEAQTGLSTIDVLKKKFKKWREENQGSRTLVCPECSKMIMLKIRTDCWDAQKYTFFKDRIITNDHLISMYHQGKITKHDVALVLGTSDDYIDWVISKIYQPNPVNPLAISNNLDLDSGVEAPIVVNSLADTKKDDIITESGMPVTELSKATEEGVASQS